MNKRLIIALSIAISGFAANTFAQDATLAPAATEVTTPAVDAERIQQWRSMTPEQRAAKRAEVRNKAQNMSPEQKAAAKQQLRNRIGSFRGRTAAESSVVGGAPL